MPMSSAVETEAVLRIRWDTGALSMEQAYAVLELDFEPSEKQMVWRGYPFIRSLIF